jgi:hypothetical protein
MADPLLLILMYFGGMAAGLVVGIVRRHGFLWTVADVAAGALFGFFAPTLLLGLTMVPWWRQSLMRAAESSALFQTVVQSLIVSSPLIGAFVGLLLVRAFRRKLKIGRPPVQIRR